MPQQIVAVLLVVMVAVDVPATLALPFAVFLAIIA
jgi:hypothetical protein